MRVILVDDEPLALRRLGILLRAHADVEVVATCAGGDEAVRAIEDERPDLALMDVRMPGLDGLQAARAISGPKAPVVVFVTAYDAYAVDAFRAHALDYLLKPVEPADLADALARVRKRLTTRETAGRAQELEAALEALKSAEDDTPDADDIWIKDRGRTVRVRQSEIVWVEAERDYVRLHLAEGSWLMRETMNRMEDRLDPALFIRVHRSAIVNRSAIDMTRATSTGSRVLVLSSGDTVRIGRSYESAVTSLVKARATN